jgi:hypothetical protein
MVGVAGSCFATSATATLGAMRLDVRYSILDTSATAQNYRYPDAYLNTRINQVQKEIVRAVFPLYNYALITPVTGQMWYTVSTDTAKIDKVSYQINVTTNNYQPLVYSTVKSLDVDRGISWESLPSGRPLNYVVINSNIGLVPSPSGSYCFPGGMKVYYYQDAADMVLDTDLPFNGVTQYQDYSSLIVLGVTIKCKKEKGVPSTDEQGMYVAMLNQFKLDVQSERPDNSVINVTH